MTMKSDFNKSKPDLPDKLNFLKLTYFAANFQDAAKDAAEKNRSHIDYLEELANGEADLKRDRSMKRRIQMAKFPVIKTLEQFQFNWPTDINQLQVKNLFRLKFIADKSNVIFLGGVGLGKSHLATAIGYEACLKGHSVLFTPAVDVINTLAAAQNAGRLKQGLNKYIKPELLIMDEIGYLPIDKTGADLLFQVISQRYERGAMIVTSNRAYKEWPEIFNQDATLTSAILDRMLHHAETVLIEGPSFRMKDKIND